MEAANHAFYLRNGYLESNLSQGRIELAGRRISFACTTIPVYILAAY